jgi:hypothetical protein
MGLISIIHGIDIIGARFLTIMLFCEKNQQ